MDKRTFLAKLIGGASTEISAKRTAPAHGFANTILPKRAAIEAGLEPYAGPWTENHASHLLRRALFGAKKEEVKAAAGKPLADTVAELLRADPEPTPPLNLNSEDPVPVSQTWVAATHDSMLNGKRLSSLKAWWTGLMLNQSSSLREKMVLFWHNHFANEAKDVGDARYLYKQNTLFRRFAFGNFKELVKQVSVDPAMLRYLDGNTNTKGNPNENFGRELLELFTVGKGPEIAPGNYTHYTEDDVKAAARILTGYKDNRTEISHTFNFNQHDIGDKSFSAAFGSTVIKGRAGVEGTKELDELIEMIFAQEETAKYLCRKLYRWFVYYVIDNATEKNIIIPLAKLLKDGGYEIKPVLDVFLRSAHFHHPLNVGCYIKTPLDLTVGTLRQLDVVFPDSTRLADQYAAWAWVEGQAKVMQMEVFAPPNVAGWSAYHQDPMYYQSWISADTLPKRKTFTDNLASTKGVGVGASAPKYMLIVDVLSIAAGTTAPGDVKDLIAELAGRMFVLAPTPSQSAFLKEVLLSGLPDYEWGVEWEEYTSNPQNKETRQVLEGKLKTLFRAMMAMAEYQLT